MVYMVVEKHTSDLLHLKRSPGIRSWSLLVGIASVGLAAAYYSSDSLLWKLFYITGCLFVALQNMEEWEDVVFDKHIGVIKLTTFNVYAVILTLWKKGHESMVLDMKHLRDINIQEEKVRYLGTGYNLVLRMATGFSHPLTQSSVLRGRSEVEELAGLLKHFLGLEPLLHQTQEEKDQDCIEDEEDFEHLGVNGDDESSDSSDENELLTQ